MISILTFSFPAAKTYSALHSSPHQKSNFQHFLSSSFSNCHRFFSPNPDVAPLGSLTPALLLTHGFVRQEHLLLLLGLHVVVGTVGEGTADEDDGVQTDAAARGRRGRRGRGGGGGDLGGGVTGLKGVSNLTSKRSRGTIPTMRFTLPTNRPSRISRASSEWPTSSNASVPSWPATSSRTSSPPLEPN